MTSHESNRRYELDWLRILAILVVFFYHSTRFFDLNDWHMKNADTYVWVEVWNVFITRWMMPLFFIISGASLFFAMRTTSRFKSFYVDKFQRLMIPVFFASVTHGAIQVYLDRLTHGRYSGSFFSFIPEYFKGVYSGIGLSGSGNFALHGMHLWYLLFLFVYGLICYRLFIWFRGKSDTDSEMTDSLWLQVDNQIENRQGSVHLGNWNSFHPVGVYAWASDVHIPLVILLRHPGEHMIRIQPRQIPHRIDQIWLSRFQNRIPDTYRSIR